MAVTGGGRKQACDGVKAEESGLGTHKGPTG